jgi:hypothetical protein
MRTSTTATLPYGAPRSGDRLPKLIDLHGTHALIVDLDVETTDLIAGEIAHEEAVDARQLFGCL